MLQELWHTVGVDNEVPQLPQTQSESLPVFYLILLNEEYTEDAKINTGLTMHREENRNPTPHTGNIWYVKTILGHPESTFLGYSDKHNSDKSHY